MKQKRLEGFDVSAFTAEEIADIYLRADLTVTLGDYFDEQNLSCEQISSLLGIPPQWVHALIEGKAEKFSSQELLEFCSKVGLQVDTSVNTVIFN